MSFRNAVLLLNLRRGRREALGGVVVHATSRSEKHSYEGKPSARISAALIAAVSIIRDSGNNNHSFSLSSESAWRCRQKHNVSNYYRFAR
jgi:hypothetical protein